MTKHQPISVCIITKNECPILEKCLQKLSPHAKKGGHEIIIVDTGSTDGTIEMCKKYTDKIYTFPWIDNFSAARNFAASKATNDWILCIDSDEFVSKWDEKNLQKMICNNPQGIGGIYQCNTCGSGAGQYQSRDKAYRLYNRTLFHFERSIHEQVCPLPPFKNRSYFMVSLDVDHFAYAASKELLQKKSLRNIALLEKELEADNHNPYTLFQLGQSYYMLEDYEKAQKYYDLGLSEDVDPRLDYVNTMVVSYGYTMIELKQYKKALELEGLYDTFSNRADFVFLMGMIYMNNGLLDDAIGQFQKATTFADCEVVGANSFRAWYNIGVIYECAGYNSQAIEAYEKCGEFPQAKARLMAIKN